MAFREVKVGETGIHEHVGMVGGAVEDRRVAEDEEVGVLVADTHNRDGA